MQRLTRLGREMPTIEKEVFMDADKTLTDAKKRILRPGAEQPIHAGFAYRHAVFFDATAAPGSE